MKARNALLLTGPYTQEDWKQFTDLMRQIERRNPEGEYRATFTNVGDTPEPTQQEILDFLDEMFPLVGQEPEKSIRRRLTRQGIAETLHNNLPFHLELEDCLKVADIILKPIEKEAGNG